MTAYEYGPRPENYEKLIRDYFSINFSIPATRSSSSRPDPNSSSSRKRLSAPAIRLGRLRVDHRQDRRDAYDDPYPMVFFIRNGKIVAANGGADDNVIGWRYARTGATSSAHVRDALIIQPE